MPGCFIGLERQIQQLARQEIEGDNNKDAGKV